MASALVVGGAWVLRVVLMVGWGGMGVGDGVRPPTMGHRHGPGVRHGGGVAQGCPKGPPRTLHARRGGALSRAVFTHTLALFLALSRSLTSCCLHLAIRFVACICRILTIS